MSGHLFLVESLPDGDSYVLSGPEGHHAADVARLRVGERLLLGDGRGGTATAVVSAVGRSRLDLSIMDRRYEVPPEPRLVVAQGLAKGDRAELAVQAMTEAGVDEILPWAASRSVVIWRDGRGLERWRTTAREAAKQSHRAWLPVVSPVVSTGALAPRVTFVLDVSAAARLSTVDLPAGVPELVLVVGPEGGVAPEELAAFRRAGAVPVRLGATVLRTSTAGVAALSVLAARLGRW
ncbi:MAG: 16S rRNA (uracil(1498)-N(3))-methyltransferase [Micromonosporaceae bacterium]|nr:16S rRNA (uracil(1498)-N(3))-methyltransferase [Micromonosporaceae bacterium]